MIALAFSRSASADWAGLRGAGGGNSGHKLVGMERCVSHLGEYPCLVAYLFSDAPSPWKGGPG